MTFTIVLAAIICGGSVVPADVVPAERPPDFVPLGVYLSWERSIACAKYLNVDRWEDMNRRLDVLETNHVNLLWVTNMAEADLPHLARECEKRHIRLLPCVDAIEAKVDWRWDPNIRYYEDVLPRIVKETEFSKAVAGWVLSDEPVEKDFPRLETLRAKLRELDPNRFATAVFMWPQAPLAPKQVKLPLVCVDLYPFFGPKDPNGPHTDATSEAFFRGNARAMLDVLEGTPSVGWVMGMCFSEIWGPRKYNDRGHLVALPGSYLHWRAPTLAEMRWQVWESFRAGAKGFVCYTLVPETPDPETAASPSPDVAWKDVLIKTDTDAGPNALTYPDGRPTLQLTELGRIYASLVPHLDIIRRWARPGDPVLEVYAGAEGQVQEYVDPESQIRYAVVINDNLQYQHALRFTLDKRAGALTDIVRNIPVAAKAASEDGPQIAVVQLEPGDGTILRVETVSN